MKNFKKNDNSFICTVCKKNVDKLHYSSRDHCNECLHSLHVDILPGDRENQCGGIMTPVDLTIDSKKGYVIQYKCKKCGKTHNNKMAKDDDFDAILSLSNKQYNKFLKSLLDEIKK